MFERRVRFWGGAGALAMAALLIGCVAYETRTNDGSLGSGLLVIAMLPAIALCLVLGGGLLLWSALAAAKRAAKG